MRPWGRSGRPGDRPPLRLAGPPSLGDAPPRLARHGFALASVLETALSTLGCEVVGPVARLELLQADETKAVDNAGAESIIEAQIPSEQFREMGLREGEMLVVTPRRARVFVETGAGIEALLKDGQARLVFVQLPGMEVHHGGQALAVAPAESFAAEIDVAACPAPNASKSLSVRLRKPEIPPSCRSDSNCVARPVRILCG